MAEIILSQAQAAEMGFLRRVHGVTLRDKMRSCEIRKTLYIEPLLRIERSQLRLFSHVARMQQERLARQVLLVKLTGKRPRGRPRTRCCDFVSDLGVEPTDLSEVAVDREVFRVLLGLLPPHPRGNAGMKMNVCL